MVDVYSGEAGVDDALLAALDLVQCSLHVVVDCASGGNTECSEGLGVCIGILCP